MRIPIRFRKPRPFDVVRMDGRLLVVHEIEWPSGAARLEPLANTLTRSLLVRPRDELITLFDALLEAGWTPPQEDR